MKKHNLTINNKQYDYLISDTKVTYQELLEYIKEFNRTNIGYNIPTEEESDLFRTDYWTELDRNTEAGTKNVIMIREILNWETPERWQFM